MLQNSIISRAFYYWKRKKQIQMRAAVLLACYIFYVQWAREKQAIATAGYVKIAIGTHENVRTCVV